MTKINTFYLTLLSVILPMTIGFSQESESAQPPVRDAVTIDPSELPENAVDLGTIGADEPITSTEPVTSTKQPVGVMDLPDAQTLEAEKLSATGMTVEEVTLEETPGETRVETIEVEATTEAPELDIPDLEINFPGDEGEMTMEFPTDVEAAPDLAMADDETISVDFPDEEVRTIISNVADLYDLNVVVPQGLEGRTTIKLRNVTWRQVFEVVLEPLEYTYVEDRNIIKIRAFAELDNQTDTRVFHINYAVASQLQGSLAPLIDASKGGLIRVDNRTNALIITERPTQMNQVTEIIERLDRPNAQVMIESKFIEITDRDQKNIGINWSSLNSYQISAGPFNRAWGRDKDSSSVKTLTATNTEVDYLNDQLALGSQYAGFNLSPLPTNQAAIDSALSLNADGDPFNDVVVPSPVFDFGGASSVVDTFSDTITRADTAVFNAQAFNVILSALQTLSDVKLVSNPTVVTLDGENALIAIGERFPVPSYTYNDERGTFEVSGFEYQDIGINLKVRPQVNSAGFIRLSITPEVSSRAGEVSFGGDANAVIPIIASRRTESEVTLKDGYTLAIGGLIESQTTDGSSAVPYLSEIPYLGRLFRSNSEEVTTRNLVIFVTAKVLNPDGTTYKEILDPRMLHSMGITDDEVPGYDIPDKELKAIEEIRRLRAEAVRVKSELEYQKVLNQLNKKEEVEEVVEELKPYRSRAR